MGDVQSESAGTEPGEPFSSTSAVHVLSEACSAVDLDPAGARLARFGENAIFVLARDSIVVRIARGDGRRATVEKEVAVSRWLKHAGILAAHVVDRLPQPVMVGRHPVTFWEFIESAAPSPGYDDLGQALRLVHDLELPSDFVLPTHEVFGRTAHRVRAARGISEADRGFLLQRELELRGRYAQLTFPTPPAPIHGDAHVENLMRGPDGNVVLIDFEAFALGQREWDLVVTGAEYESAHWITEAQYRQFVAGYGADITAWDGYEVLRDVQELKMTTWLMQNIHEGTDVAEEFQRRLASIRDNTTRRGWRPY